MCSIDTNQKEIIKNFLLENLSPYLITLFGSAAAHKLRPDSDIDIAFLTDFPKSDYDTFMLAQELSGLIGRDVDLVDLNKASSVFKAQILGKGEKIYNSDNYKSGMFCIRALKEYTMLNEERQCIIDRIKERGYANEQ